MPHRNTLAMRRMFRSLLTFDNVKQNPELVDQYISTLLSLEQNPTSLVLLGVCLDFCSAHKDKATIEKHKVSLLDRF